MPVNFIIISFISKKNQIFNNQYRYYDSTENTDDDSPTVILRKNVSGRFESRFSTVKIRKSPSIMLRDMENSILGVWVAHGEGL